MTREALRAWSRNARVKPARSELRPENRAHKYTESQDRLTQPIEVCLFFPLYSKRSVRVYR